MKKVIKKIPGKTEIYYKLDFNDLFTKLDITTRSSKDGERIPTLKNLIDNLLISDIRLLMSIEWNLNIPYRIYRDFDNTEFIFSLRSTE